MTQSAKLNAQDAKSRAPKPSGFWCGWQALKGTNFRRLSVPDADLRGIWIIITGGNSGIGKEAALQFARWGANIVLGCREPPPHEPHPDVVVRECQAAARASDHQNSSIEWWPCDMVRLRSVQAFGERWLATGRPLDILANNAGMPGNSAAVKLTEDGFEIVHQVNFLSHVFLTMLLLPSIKKATKPRIICTTSCMQYLGEFDLANANSGVNSYQNNKLYFQTWLTELQYRMIQQADCKHIIVVGIHPGFVQTNIWRSEAGAGPAPRGSGALVGLQKYVGIDAQQGSIAITHAATGPEQRTKPESQSADKMDQSRGGTYANRIWQEEPMPQTKDPRCRLEVWEFVEKELKLQEKGLLHGLGV